MTLVIDWQPMSTFPTDGRTVFFLDGAGGINFARYEPEAGLCLKIVSSLGATRLGSLRGRGWAELGSAGTS
jgi:hypothetical protein